MENFELNKMKENLNSMLDGIEGIIDTKKVIGEPYTVGDTTIIPFIETSFGMGVGEFKSDKGAGGMGCKISPIACLIIQNGFTKVVNIKNQDVVSKALDMIPDLVDKLTNANPNEAEVNKSIKKLKPKYEK